MTPAAAVTAWITANEPAIALGVVLYFALSLARMPPPRNPWAFSAWWMLRTLCCHTWDEWGGRLKWPLLPPVPWPAPPLRPMPPPGGF